MTNYLETFTQVVATPRFIMFMLGAMAAVLLVTYTESVVALRRRAGKTRRLRETVLARLKADLNITPADLDRFRNAHGLDAASAKRVLDDIYAEPPSKDTTPAHLASLRRLFDQLEVNEPYDHLPAEVRPSLARIQDILGDSADRPDTAVLAPILAALNDGADLARQKGVWPNTGPSPTALALLASWSALPRCTSRPRSSS